MLFQRLRVDVIRVAERFLPCAVLRAVIAPIILIRCLRTWRVDRQMQHLIEQLPSPFQRPTSRLATFRARYQHLAMTLIRNWPERLCEPRWQARCHLFGEDVLLAARASGRPIILTSVHYGGLGEMVYWLRSKRLPLAVIVIHPKAYDEARKHYFLIADRVNGLVDVLPLFGTDTQALFDIRDFLEKGRMLLCAIDLPYGRRTSAVQVDGIEVTIQLGVFTIAAVTNAIVIPTLFRNRPGMECDIHFRSPVPDGWVTDRKHHPQAAQHVLNELMPLIEQCPEQADPPLLSKRVSPA